MNDLWTGMDEHPLYDEPREGDIHLSQTTVNNAQLCGGKVLYKGTEGFNNTPSEAMSYGTMAHAMAEGDLKCLIEGRPLVEWTAKSVEGLWADGLLNERDGSWVLTDLAGRELIDKSVKEALRGHSLWRRDVLPTLLINDEMLVEQRVTKCLGVLPDGRAVWFGGTADVVDPFNGMVYDWKTSGRSWDQSKADAGNQASFYSWLYGIHTHTYWVFVRSAPKWEMFFTSRTEEEVEAAKRLAWQTAKAMASGSLIVQPWASTFGKYKRAWYCSARWCAAWDVCEFKAINDNVYEAQAIDIKEGWT